MVMTYLISSSFLKWVPVTTSFSFGSTKKSQEARSLNTMVVPGVRCCFWPNAAKCLGPCEPEHYRDEGRIQHLFFHISGLFVCTATSRCCCITFDARGVVHFSSSHRMKQLTSMSTERYCNICSEQYEQED